MRNTSYITYSIFINTTLAPENTSLLRRVLVYFVKFRLLFPVSLSDQESKGGFILGGTPIAPKPFKSSVSALTHQKFFLDMQRDTFSNTRILQ